ncbi:hypothetical protein [Nocardia otitidiscaviarum]|uniref:hypothetical protein n=1 Tax=Nocardia otitidiscaviarum TaxID=1823 RepID=UPI002458BC88|nr:hypothetical protein [Nocardia otitidiscaviarum]
MPQPRQDRFEADLGTVSVVTDRGLVHEHNEDSVAVAVLDGPTPGQPGATVIVVCDGVSTSEDPQAASGAAARAGVAASLAALGAGAVLEEVALAGLSAAAKAVRAVGTPEGRAPSCTYVSAVLVPTADGTHITVANVGDSRAYWLAAPTPPAPATASAPPESHHATNAAPAPGAAAGRAAPGAPAPSGVTGATAGTSVSTGHGASAASAGPTATAAPGATAGSAAAGAPATSGSSEATDAVAGTSASAGPGASAAPGAAAGSTAPGGSAPSGASGATSTTAGTSAWTGSGASAESGASAGSGAMGAAVDSAASGGSAASGVSGVTDTTGAGASAFAGSGGSAGSGGAVGAGVPGDLGVVTGSRRLTDDDSLAQDFIKISGVDERTAMSMRGAHTLTRWLGADIGTTPWAEDNVRSLHATGPGALLLCSDGLWNYLPEAEALGDYTFGPAGATGPVGLSEARALVDFAIRQGGSDNITVALAPVPGAAQPPR